MMKPFYEIVDCKIPYKQVFSKGKYYIDLPCSFDLETTSTYTQEGEKIAFPYVWACSIGKENCFYGRTMDEFVLFCQYLKTNFALYIAKQEEKEQEETTEEGEKPKSKPKFSKHLIIYVHNLSYEFQFIRKYFQWETVFAINDRKPLKAVNTMGIEFRCSYMLSGYSLANTAKNLTQHTIKKLVGSLDYSLVRHEETYLTETELEYLENDILIVTYYITEQISLYGDIGKIPLTNTGRVRNYVRNECYYTSKNHRKSSKSKYKKYRQIMEDLTLDASTYKMLKRAFMGGFTHANAIYSGELLENVSSIDFTSSYPSVMVSEMFPMSRFKDVQVESNEHFKELCENYAVVADLKFINIRCKIPQEVYISESKCFSSSKTVVNNGRIFSAGEIQTTLTELDFSIMSQVYEWDSLEYGVVKIAYKAYLPKSIVMAVLNLYQDKTVLKDVAGKEVEYLLSKGMLNSVYGMCVTDIVKDTIVYNDAWGIERVDIEEEIKKYNEAKNRFLYYAWGLWVTAYARKNLWTGILTAGMDYIYSDTDSLKVLNYDKLTGYVEWYNNSIIEKMLKMCEYHKIDSKLLSPKTQDGKVKTMGIWDFEGTYKRFKTLGAKRYLVEKENGEMALTVAGLSKQNGLEYMKEVCENDNKKVFEMFNTEMHIPEDRTGKMTHTYIDEEMIFYCVDYRNEGKEVIVKSAVHLEKTFFTLSVSGEYLEFLKQMKQGYLYKGLNYI